MPDPLLCPDCSGPKRHDRERCAECERRRDAAMDEPGLNYPAAGIPDAFPDLEADASDRREGAD